MIPIHPQAARALLQAMISAESTTDSDRTAAVLSGVSIVHDPKALTFTVSATSGHVLYEEICDIKTAGLSGYEETVIEPLPPMVVEVRPVITYLRALWRDINQRSKHSWLNITGYYTPKQEGVKESLTLASIHGPLSIRMRLIQGTFPNYRPALDQKPVETKRIGIDQKLIDKMAKAFNLPKHSAGMTWEFGRGVICRPLNQNGRNRQVLLMTINLPT
jgi:hypothetical protein